MPGSDVQVDGVTTATLLLYLVASLGVQRVVVAYRVQRLDLAGLRAPVAGRAPW
jgi:hypothetical protein